MPRPAPPRPSTRSAVPAFRVMEILAAVERLRAEGRDVVSLCAGEPSGGAPRAVARAAARVHARNEGLGYTPALGTEPLRRAVAGHYARWYGLEVSPEDVAITTGASGALVLTFLAAFDVGDRVAVCRPGYPAYRNTLAALGADVVELDCGPATRFQPTPAMLDAAAARHGPLRGLVVAGPANPTGTLLAPEELAALARWCAEHGTRLISDEIYHGIVHAAPEGAGRPGGRPYRGASAWEHDRDAVVISSFSKYWGMTGWRLGWALLPRDLVAPVDALAGNVSLCPPAAAQHAAVEAFSEESYAAADRAVEGFARSRGLLLDALPALGWGETAPADGAFYLYAELGEQLERHGSSLEWCRRLLEAEAVAVVPGLDFDAARGHRTVRLSFAAGPDRVEEAIRRILRFQARP
ncbi:aminotransferase class I/II-fold pyridoxal phosphate-dependent enzyme [Kocuria rosea]|uniref:aminotransferase class I/II-fold pyridoxal phosphate-dependent enzyme n=1 Tax=Kocuria rosea TaxID=1275 RepID=UPI00203A93E6|nr:aminotransferase class I/II-fold pyridoxal phosphate-dependent enzyme [Kocuria rosea]MCM3686458.1 aminotransferase class I/II-fold pyridoxal phosphate-dependent enzyme [Kocuria rosea]HST72298.1 aminotransferase class I/II-fold pyridoxal phosphate-dependent enzyme [Kocuria rosea]